MTVKVGDKFIVLPNWDITLDNEVGTVVELYHDNIGFYLSFHEGTEERGPFYGYEIGHIIRPLNKLERALR